MKRWICVILCAAMVLCLAACGKTQPKEVDLKAAAAEAAAVITENGEVLFPEENPEVIESLYPGLTAVELKQLVVSMLNYGAQAQLYFGHNPDQLANSSVTSEPLPYREDMTQKVPAVPSGKQGSFSNNHGFSLRRPAVSFEGAFSINYFFTPAYTPVDGITLYYWNEADYNAANVLSAENATGSIAMEAVNGDQYRGDIEGISAKSLSEAFYVAAVYSDGTTTWTSGVLGYSIGAYCAGQISQGGSIADLAKATAVYGYYAKQYFD